MYRVPAKEGEINAVVLKYVNRLSDYLFAVARVINASITSKRCRV